MAISPLSTPKTRPATSPSVNETQKATSTEATTATATATKTEKPAAPVPASVEQATTPITQASKEAARAKAGAAETAVKNRRLQPPPSTPRASAARGIQASNLKKGGRGPRVQDLQQRLNEMGAGLSKDGIYGPKTEAAVKAFQTRAGLNPDGIMGPKTMAALDATQEAMQTMPKESLRWGASGDAVNAVQNQLKSMGYKLATDGYMGNETYGAVRDFQSRAGLPIDGVVGSNTKTAMNEVQSGQRKLAKAAQSDAPTNVNGTVQSRTDVPNNVAQFDKLTKVGRRNQMAHGRITVNGNTYDFRSGGGGRGNLPPGEYKVTRHLDRRSDKSTMMVDGVGYSFALSDKYDSRVKSKRTLLRVHPDGGGPGTIGCIGIVGNGQVQKAFRKDMLAEIARNGGSYTLKVQE